MKDEKLMRLALAVFLVGIAAICAVTLFTGPESVKIGSLDEGDAGRQVIVNGTVLSATTSDGNTFLKISDGSGNITAVIFERAARSINQLIVKGDNLLLTGQVNVYKGELEIIVERLWK